MTRANKIKAIEWSADAGSAAIIAVAVAFALRAVLVGGATIWTIAAVLFVLVCAGLRHLPEEERSWSLPLFELAPIEIVEPDGQEELLLDDRLITIPENARIVQLFGPRSEHEPIDTDGLGNSRHSRLPLPDATQALSDALAELRRSLR